MSIERVIDYDIPYDEEAILSDNPKELADYLRKLVKSLKDFSENVRQKVNLQIDLFDGDAIYFSTKNANGEYDDDTWRMYQSGNNLITEVKINGTWTTVFTRERPV